MVPCKKTLPVTFISDVRLQISLVCSITFLKDLYKEWQAAFLRK